MGSSASASPLVSVCIPSYRGTRHLDVAIQSVLAQTFPAFELVIIDNHSQDGTADLVRRYADPRIRFMENPVNLGAEGNWNRCLAEARGTYVKLLPHDDVLARSCLERQVQILETDVEERLALVFSSRTIIDEGGRTIHARGYPGGKLGVIPARDVLRRCLRYGTNLIGEPGGVLFRRSLAPRIGSFDAAQAYVIDLDYWFRLLLHGDAYYVPEPLVAFRVSSQSWSVAIGSRQSADFRSFMDRIAKNPRYETSGLDLAIGRIMAHANKLGRSVFYRFFLNRSVP
jgi:glycosyltransferase involved in cell wall biosynthesis